MLLLSDDASFVCLENNTGGLNSLYAGLVRYFMVVTIHAMCDFCWQSRLRLVFMPYYGLCHGPVFDCLYVYRVMLCC